MLSERGSGLNTDTIHTVALTTNQFFERYTGILHAHIHHKYKNTGLSEHQYFMHKIHYICSRNRHYN